MKKTTSETTKTSIRYWKLAIDGYYALEYHALMSKFLIDVEKAASFGKRFFGLVNFEKYYEKEYNVKEGFFDNSMIIVAVKMNEKNHKLF